MARGERILVGVVGAAQGIKGEVRLKSYTADPRAIGGYGPLGTEDGRSLAIVSLRSIKGDMLAVRFAGVADRDAAAALTNTRLYVDRARLPPPEAGEFYQADLIGLMAESEDGRALGRVVGVENFGAGDILEIAPETGDTLLVPFTEAFVPLVEIELERLVVARGALAEDGDAEGGEAEEELP